MLNFALSVLKLSRVCCSEYCSAPALLCPPCMCYLWMYGYCTCRKLCPIFLRHVLYLLNSIHYLLEFSVSLNLCSVWATQGLPGLYCWVLPCSHSTWLCLCWTLLCLCWSVSCLFWILSGSFWIHIQLFLIFPVLGAGCAKTLFSLLNFFMCCWKYVDFAYVQSH
jgi:hypothetical protein